VGERWRWRRWRWEGVCEQISEEEQAEAHQQQVKECRHILT